MPFQLGIGTGSQAGRVIGLPLNTPLSIGRTRATLLFPDDPTMSGLHFELVCDERTVAIRNHSQTNGTYVNGVRVEEAMLHAGDVIMAGGTRFTLAASGEHSLSETLKIQHWFFPAPPGGWEQLDDQGLRYLRDGSQATTLMITEEAIPAGHTLDQYVDIQLRLIRERLQTAQAVKAPLELTDVEASMGLSIRSELADGRVVMQKQIYASVGQAVGILTATILESEPAEIHEAVDKLLMTASFRPSGKQTESASAATQSES
jgi:hypothetical protein